MTAYRAQHLDEAAEFEDLYIWSPDVLTRQVPKPNTSFGSGSSAKAISFNGEVVWLNIPNKDSNPFSDIGFFAARLYAAGVLMYGQRPSVKLLARALRGG